MEMGFCFVSSYLINMKWIMGFPPKVRVIELVGMVRSLRLFLFGAAYSCHF